MHPETKKLTQKKHALSNTNTDRKSKATAKPLFSRLLRHPARKRSGSILGQTHTCLLTYLLAPDPHGAVRNHKYERLLQTGQFMATHGTCSCHRCRSEISKQIPVAFVSHFLFLTRG